MTRVSAIRLAGLLLAGSATSLSAQAVTDSMVLSLDSLLSTKISTAAKYQQTMSEAASSVTIITAEDIHRHGYRTLPEALAATRGFYLSYDRNYSFLGARGFSRPSDYNNRILVLVDGNAINESVFGGAPVGTDLGVPMESLERIEIVRGPGVGALRHRSDLRGGQPRYPRERHRSGPARGGSRRQLRRPRRHGGVSRRRLPAAWACPSPAPGTAPTAAISSIRNTPRRRATAASPTTWTGSGAGRCSAG